MVDRFELPEDWSIYEIDEGWVLSTNFGPVSCVDDEADAWADAAKIISELRLAESTDEAFNVITGGTLGESHSVDF